MPLFALLTSLLISTTSLTIVEPMDGETYNGDWLPLRAIVENENELPDSVHYSLNGASVVPVPRLNTDWPTYMQNYQNIGYSESPAPTDNTILWSAFIKGFYHEFPTPVVAEGIVYYTEDSLGDGVNDSLYAFDAATGDLIWKYDTGHADDAVTVVDGRLYSPSDSLFCLDALTGARIWASDVANHSGSTPIVMSGRVYCGTTLGGGFSTVCCLDAVNGSPVWVDTLSGGTVSCQAYWNGMLFVPTIGDALYALDTDDGSIIWQNTDSEDGYWDSSPVIADGIIYINDATWGTFGIDALTGQTIWQQPTGGATATIAYHGNRLFFAEENGPYQCLDATNGTTIWTSPYSQHGSSGIADGIVFFGERVEFGTPDSSRVVALDCETGNTVWTFATSSTNERRGFQSSPSITDGVMYYTCTDGYLYAFGTGLKYTYRDDWFYADVGTNELIVTSFDGGTAVAADTISFTVTGTGIALDPSPRLRLNASPNPFHSMTTVSFELSAPGHTSVEIFDLSGRLVRTLVSSDLDEGVHSIPWAGYGESGELVPSGLYLCLIRSGDIMETTGMCLLR